MHAFVHLSGRYAGRLTLDEGRFSFAYEATTAIPLSLRLPVRERPYDDGECRSFFVNLLPEGAWRSTLCRQLKLAEGDDRGLLLALGKDCAGAVQITATREEMRRAGRFVALDESELRQWVKNAPSRPRLDAAPGLRLSLAGAQDKLLIHYDDGRAFLCEDGAPSNVILKPDIVDPHSGIELSALNELAVMFLARRVGLDVCDHSWIAGAYAAHRFDRRGSERLHQEDFAQLLGRFPSEKYDVGWRDCFELVDQHVAVPVLARRALLHRLLFSLFVGNRDAHGKNFALLHDGSGRVVLSPAYDLLCTTLYPSLNADLAMSVGGCRRVGELTREHWSVFAAEVGTKQSYLRREAEKMSAALRAELPSLPAVLEERFPDLKKDVYPLRRRREFLHALTNEIERHLNAGVGFDR